MTRWARIRWLGVWVLAVVLVWAPVGATASPCLPLQVDDCSCPPTGRMAEACAQACALFPQAEAPLGVAREPAAQAARPAASVDLEALVLVSPAVASPPLALPRSCEHQHARIPERFLLSCTFRL